MWRSLLSAVGWMLLSGALLVSGFLAYHLPLFQDNLSSPEVWKGNRLHLIEGKGGGVDGGLEIRALSAQEQAIISSGRVAVRAEQYAFLQYEFQGFQSNMEPVFFWRRAEAPARLVSLPLEGGRKGSAVVRLARHEAWQGTIIEFGIGFHRILPAPVIIKELIFKPASAATLLAAVWSEWTTFEGWTQRSINFVEGHDRDALLPPVPAVAAWVGLALLLYGIWSFWRGQRWDWRVGGVVFLLGWVALDLRWQAGLWSQLQETYDRYGGKDWKAKHLAAEDGPLFGFITAVKSQLPPPPQRIFLVTATSLENESYTRQRAYYHLLPYNVHSYGAYPPGSAHAQEGDYVLILGAIPELAFSAEQQLLRWGRGSKKQLAVERIYTASLGTLYKVREEANSL
jgi:hypothetical protein